MPEWCEMVNIYDAPFRSNMTYCVETTETRDGRDMRHVAVLQSRAGLSFKEAREFQQMREKQGYNAVIRTWGEKP